MTTIKNGVPIPAIESAALNIETAASDIGLARDACDEEHWTEAVVWIANAISQLTSAKRKIAISQCGKDTMEMYDIIKDGKLFASFTYGDPSRFGTPFNREIAGKEYDACRTFWENKGAWTNWELRIHEANAEHHQRDDRRVS